MRFLNFVTPLKYLRTHTHTHFHTPSDTHAHRHSLHSHIHTHTHTHTCTHTHSGLSCYSVCSTKSSCSVWRMVSTFYECVSSDPLKKTRFAAIDVLLIVCSYKKKSSMPFWGCALALYLAFVLYRRFKQYRLTEQRTRSREKTC